MKRHAGIAAALFALLILIDYYAILFGKVPVPHNAILRFPAWADHPVSEGPKEYAYLGDLITYFYPIRSLASRAIAERTIPLWNPYFQSGAPYQADPQTSLFYPPNFVYYFLPLPIAWTVCVLLRLLLAGLFMTLFARSIGATRESATFAGIVFAFCGFMTVWQGYSIGDSAVWLPLICYSVLRIHRQPSPLSIVLAGVAFAMPLLAGHPETAAHLTAAGLLLAVGVFATTRSIRFLSHFAAAGVLALGLASIQMIPTLEWLGQMEAALESVWPPLASDQIVGLASRDILRGTNSANVIVPESTAYIGMITLIAAPLAFLHRLVNSTFK